MRKIANKDTLNFLLMFIKTDKLSINITIQLSLVVGHWLEIIIDHRLESVAAVDAIF